MSAKEYREMIQSRSQKQKNSKYNNAKTVVDGIEFDSEKESMRYAELKMMEKAGVIQDLKLQVPFILQPAFYKDGERIQAIKYVADFTYTKDGETVIEDVKSDGTRKNKVYQLKKKMMEYRGNYIKEI